MGHLIYNPNLWNTDGAGLGIQGWLIIAENEGCTQLLEHFYNEGVTPLGSQALERLRILKGRPRAGLELTESCTVLEVIYLAIAANYTFRFDFIDLLCLHFLNPSHYQQAKLWHTIDEDKARQSSQCEILCSASSKRIYNMYFASSCKKARLRIWYRAGLRDWTGDH